MQQQDYFVSAKMISCYFDADFSYLEKLTSKNQTVLITDEHVFAEHTIKFKGWKSIRISAGEQFKQQATIDYIIKQLIEFKADRGTFIVGVGGGVVTDIAGYVASVYMRGVKFGFVPTTILAMVDASIGGKNGIDAGLYKNLIGTISQPAFLLYDYSFLSTLPQGQWINGFAEIIKHACIKDAQLFNYLESKSVSSFESSIAVTDLLIKNNVKIKYALVAKDELETGDRKLLNFGHTLGHAIENTYTLPHGHAVSIGIAAACIISGQLNHFSLTQQERVIALLKKYHLPVTVQFDKERIWQLLLLDKKKSGDFISFILLNKIGEAIIKPVALTQLQEIFNHIQL